MRCSQRINRWLIIFNITLLALMALPLHAEENMPFDRVVLATKQIELLKNREQQVKAELSALQNDADAQVMQFRLQKTNKKLVDKAALDILVAKSNLDSISIELSDAQQNIAWLEKNIQELNNQLDVLNMFGTKVAHLETANIKEYRADLSYQKKLVHLEKTRLASLENLKINLASLLQLKKETHARLSSQLQSYRLLNLKQQQVKDVLVYQEEQNQWLHEVNKLYAHIAQLDSLADREAYTATERNIFYANERASYAYTLSVIARYKDQIQQMKLAVYKSNSISLLNEISDQVPALSKQILRLDTVLKSREAALSKHISYLSQRKNSDPALSEYVHKLKDLENNYSHTILDLKALNEGLVAFRVTLEQALQTELSARQGFPSFGFKMLLDLGKEMLLVPTLVFHIVKSLGNNLVKGIETTSFLAWSLFVIIEASLLFIVFFLRKWVLIILDHPAEWRHKINSKWLSLQWFKRNFIEFILFLNLIGVMSFFSVPAQNYLFLIYLLFVWLVFKSIKTIMRVCLVEATHDTTGHDVRLYRRLNGLMIAGGVITALTVFAHQLPLVYELKTLFDRLFLLFTMLVSFLVLRSWHVVPHMILSHMETQHPYLEKSIRFVGFLIPVLIFCNSLIGLFGYVNLVMTISGYEGIFLVVLICYLTLRGLLSDGILQISNLVIQHVNNGWLLTEAFLKPIDKLLRLTLFFSAWVVLFLLYGWDKQSPIVERLTRMLHYNLVSVLNTVITPMGIIELFFVIAIFYWTAKWTREFVYRLLQTRTKDMGLRNSIAVLSQYSVVILGAFICLRVLGIDLSALTYVVTAFSFGIGLGLRDLANNFACGFLILLERPLRVGDIVSINNIEGEVTHIGSRAVTVRTWDFTDLVVPNAEIFNKSFTNWTFKDNIVRTVAHVKIARRDNPREVKAIINNILSENKHVLKEPIPEVLMKEIDDITMEFEIRYYVNIRQITSRVAVLSEILMTLWDEFSKRGIKPPYPQQEVYLRRGAVPTASFIDETEPKTLPNI